jgi:C4-dicarboxylate transporter DctM subunit
VTGLALWFLALLALGVPVALVLGLATTIYLLGSEAIALSVIPQRMFAGLDQFVLMSIPFFILAGFVMNETQLTGRLVQFAHFLVGRWRGGLAQVNVLTSMFFGGITGAATADAAAIGSIMIPAMIKDGYRRDFATAVTVASSLCGPLIPPSIPMLVYGISSGASIGSLFLAGATPGIAIGVAMLGLNRFLLSRMPPREAVDAIPTIASAGRGWVGFLTSLRAALIALAMPVIIVGGVVGGVFTPTESSVAAVLYAVVVGFALRTLEPGALWRLIASAAIVSATIMLIVANANLLGWVLAFERIPQAVAEFFLALTDQRWVFLSLVMLLLIVVGLFLETSGAIIILTPVLLPAAEGFGFDPVHFGVVMVFGLVIGLLTPPVGLCLFVGCSLANISLDQLARAVLPYLALLIVVYLVFAFVPAASLWLPRLVMQ